MREDDLHWLDEGIIKVRKIEVLGMVVMKALAKGVRVLRGIYPLLVVMIKMVVMAVKKLVVMNLMIAIMGETKVLKKGPMVLMKANKVVLLCHGIQIIMPHKTLIIEAD